MFLVRERCIKLKITTVQMWNCLFNKDAKDTNLDILHSMSSGESRSFPPRFTITCWSRVFLTAEMMARVCAWLAIDPPLIPQKSKIPKLLMLNVSLQSKPFTLFFNHQPKAYTSCYNRSFMFADTTAYIGHHTNAILDFEVTLFDLYKRSTLNEQIIL